MVRAGSPWQERQLLESEYRGGVVPSAGASEPAAEGGGLVGATAVVEDDVAFEVELVVAGDVTALVLVVVPVWPPPVAVVVVGLTVVEVVLTVVPVGLAVVVVGAAAVVVG